MRSTGGSWQLNWDAETHHRETIRRTDTLSLKLQGEGDSENDLQDLLRTFPLAINL